MGGATRCQPGAKPLVCGHFLHLEFGRHKSSSSLGTMLQVTLAGGASRTRRILCVNRILLLIEEGKKKKQNIDNHVDFFFFFTRLSGHLQAPKN